MNIEKQCPLVSISPSWGTQLLEPSLQRLRTRQKVSGEDDQLVTIIIIETLQVQGAGLSTWEAVVKKEGRGAYIPG